MGPPLAQDYYSACSFGKARFNSSYNIIVGPIDMPCSGTGSAGPWTAGACGNSEIWGWASWVEDWARTVSIKTWQPSMHASRWAVLGKA